jgi:mRNA-degrading endonuclease RelE of RelBE toxin-antitoxin system
MSLKPVFSILIHKKAFKEIDGFPAEDKQRILSAIREMATYPFSGYVKPIRGIKGLLRRRVGEYRIAFTINFENAEVIILRAARRGKFY